MSKGIIKKEQELKDGRMYFKVMLKRDRLFSLWYEEFGSFNKKDTDDMFYEISKARNITTKSYI